MSVEARPPAIGSAAPVTAGAAVEAALDSFDRAVRRTGAIERRFRIGGEVVRLVFAGPALLPAVARALAPRAVPAGEPPAPPVLDVGIYDTASTGIGPPPLPSEPGGPDLRTFLRPEVPSINVLDRRRGRAIHWVAAPHRVPAHDAAAPLRAILQWRAEERGAALVHAAAVGRPSGGVLLAGKGGSGKSTAALACALRSSLLLAGDDYVLVEPGAGGTPPFAHALYATAKLHDDSLARFPELSAREADEGAGFRDPVTGKLVVFLDAWMPEKLASWLPVRAILLPRVTPGGGVRVVPASPGQALLTLAPSTIFQLLEASADSLIRAMTALVASVPCFAIEVGAEADLWSIPAAIEGLLG